MSYGMPTETRLHPKDKHANPLKNITKRGIESQYFHLTKHQQTQRPDNGKSRVGNNFPGFGDACDSVRHRRAAGLEMFGSLETS